jgi:3-hydroxybutyryl-CoA dehydrogenase
MKIGVIGAGVMGRGIAQVSAMAGHKVVLFDINHDTLVTAQEGIEKNLNKAIELGKLDADGKFKTLANLQYSNSIAGGYGHRSHHRTPRYKSEGVG